MRDLRVVVAPLALVSFLSGCGGRGGQPPERPPVVYGPSGKISHVVDKGDYKAFYDAWGRLERIEYDSNKDGKPDQIAHYEGGRTVRLLEVDEDFDGRIDRWDYYDEKGELLKVGRSRRHRGPDVWTYEVGGKLVRREFDEDGDGRVDRTEYFENARLARVEIDADRNGKVDRWQYWSGGRLAGEDLDTDGDGKPDRRIRYGLRREILKMEKLRP